MLVPLSWLREYCDPKLDTHGIAQRLTMTGTNVEAVHRHGVPSGERFFVGRVLSTEPHPDADRLRVCTVDLGDASRPDPGGGPHLPPPGPSVGPVTIVCGAPNVAAGQTVAVARPGAVMPDGMKLSQAKLRGVTSDGMILAENELELGPGGDGILVLDDIFDTELVPGTPLAEVLPIAVDVLELEITPNRPDCLGVFGVARELHAASGAPLAPAPWLEDLGSAGTLEGVEIRVQCPELCPRFTARRFEEVAIGPSPLWLKAALLAAGQRPINNVVDVTNYAMLLTGQPLHAFDLDRVAGGCLVVRRARDGEQVQTLDGQTRTLDREMVLIEDAEGPTSIAGVMGGARSEVGPDTRRALLEAATWVGPNIHRSSWALGLRSEASSRFEKGLQPEQCMHAQAVATRLLVEVCGAKLAPGTVDLGGPGAPPRVVRLREARVRGILGVSVARARQREILTALDFGVQDAAAPPAGSEMRAKRASPGQVDGVVGLDVTIPPLRRDDVTREVDLIEEVARIDGLERLPPTLPARRDAVGLLTHAQRVRRAAEDALVGRGLYEIVGWSFADPALLDRLLLPADHELRRVVTLENPLSDAQSIMRPTLLGSLLDAARHNVARNGPGVAIFESGTVYAAAEGVQREPVLAGPLAETEMLAETGMPARGGRLPASAKGESVKGECLPASVADEHHSLAALLGGRLQMRSWRGERAEDDGRTADFFAAKALLAALLDRFHVDWSVQPQTWPFLHPGRSAAILVGGESAGGVRLGYVGELHPLVATAWDLEGGAAFAIDLGKLAAAAPELVTFESFSAAPPLRIDLAVTLPVEVPAAEALARAREAGGETLEAVDLFDVYAGEQVGRGRRSLALALSFRAADRTLTDEDVAPWRERIVAVLQELGGELRG